MKVYHLDAADHWKHEENSGRGIHAAIAQHCDAIDIDGLLSRIATWYGEHWMEPMDKDNFYDPLHILGRYKKMKYMYDYQIGRLRSRDGNPKYRISKMNALFQITAESSHTLIDLVEPKYDWRFASDAPWIALRTMAQRHFGSQWNQRVQVRALWPEPLPHARAAGFKAWKI